MSDNIVKINVGGVIYCTTRSTLCKYPESTLCAIFNEGSDTTKDENGCYFIDRDGEMFKYILNFLRSSKLALPKVFSGLQQIRLEAEFYKITPLVKIVDGLLKPTHLMYLNIIEEQRISETIITIQGKADTITKYFSADVKLGTFSSITTNGLAELVLNYKVRGLIFAFGDVLSQIGWKLASSCMTSKAQGAAGLSFIVRDTWSLEQ